MLLATHLVGGANDGLHAEGDRVGAPLDQHQLLDQASVGLGIRKVEDDKAGIISGQVAHHLLKGSLVCIIGNGLSLVVNAPVERDLGADLQSEHVTHDAKTE